MLTSSVYIPTELIDLIADYHDYDKYCKPAHKNHLDDVLCDIIEMSKIMPRITPHLVIQCWGTQSHKLLELSNSIFEEAVLNFVEYSDSDND